MNDQERMADFLTMEKKLGSNYDLFASECVNLALRNEFIKSLTQSHATQTELFQAAQSRGWYQVEQAQQDKITQAKTKFSAQIPQ
ncbi:MAG: spore coat protein [Oscillospiraceae bacterium]|nr:spore coat protein [Oscillospiraceae bacterium]